MSVGPEWLAKFPGRAGFYWVVTRTSGVPVMVLAEAWDGPVAFTFHNCHLHDDERESDCLWWLEVARPDPPLRGDRARGRTPISTPDP